MSDTEIHYTNAGRDCFLLHASVRPDNIGKLRKILDCMDAVFAIPYPKPAINECCVPLTEELGQ